MATTPPTAPAPRVEIDEPNDIVRVSIPLDYFRSLNPQALASIEQGPFLTSTHAAEIRRIVSQPKHGA